MVNALLEILAPNRTTRGFGNPVSLMAGASPGQDGAGLGWALEGDQNFKTAHTVSKAHGPFLDRSHAGHRAPVMACTTLNLPPCCRLQVTH